MLRLDDFKRHHDLCGTRSGLESGFLTYFQRRKLNSIFIIDSALTKPSDRKRKTTEDDYSPLEIRVWKQFLGVYAASFNSDKELFSTTMFEPRESWLKSGEYTTLAESIFGISESRLSLTKEIQKLASNGILLVPDIGADVSMDGEESSDASPLTRATLRSLNPGELLDGLEGTSPCSLDIRVARGVIRASDELSAYSDKGDIFMMLWEECLLMTLIQEEELLSASKDTAEKAFELMLADRLKEILKPLGHDFPSILLCEASITTEASPSLGSPTRLLRHSDLRIMFSRYMQLTVGNSYIRDRERRLAALRILRTAWYSKQVFRPWEDKTLLEYFRDRAHYQSGQYQFATKASLLRQARLDSEGARPFML